MEASREQDVGIHRQAGVPSTPEDKHPRNTQEGRLASSIEGMQLL